MINLNWHPNPPNPPVIFLNTSKFLLIILTLYLSSWVGTYISPMIAAFFTSNMP